MASSTSQEIVISPVTSVDDLPIITTIEGQAFSSSPLITLMFPHTPTSHAKYVAQHTKDLLTNANARYVKASLPSGEIIGYGKWLFYLTPEAIADSEKPWPLEDDGSGSPNVPMAKFVFGELGKRKNSFMSGKRHALMAVLVVKPEAQRMGAGKKLLEWGLRECDREEIEVWIDASPMGKGLYEKCGWKEVGHLDTELEQFGGEGVLRTVCMLRKPVPVVQSDSV